MVWQIKSSSNAKHAEAVEEPVAITIDDDGGDEWDRILQEANGSNARSDVEGEGEGKEDRGAPMMAIPSGVAAPAVLPASITDDLGGGLGFGNEGSMGAFFRRKRR